MFRLKTLSVLAGMIAVLAVSAAPASAWWEATGKQLKGPVKVVTAGTFVDGGTEVTCPANETQATWSIQTKGQIKDHENQLTGKQVQTKFGPHLNIKIYNWGAACKAKIGTVGEFAAEVKPCELQLVQQKESLTATGGVVTTCVVKAGPCVIQVPAGMEIEPGSNKGINVGLPETELKNKVNGQEFTQFDKVATKGVLAQRGSGSNALCPVVTNENSELKGLEFELQGVKAV